MNIAKSTSLARAFRSNYSLSSRIFVRTMTLTFELSSNIEEEIKITRWNGKNARKGPKDKFIKDQRYDHYEAIYFNVLLDILTPLYRMSVKITRMDENERFELFELVATLLAARDDVVVEQTYSQAAVASCTNYRTRAVRLCVICTMLLSMRFLFNSFSNVRGIVAITCLSKHVIYPCHFAVERPLEEQRGVKVRYYQILKAISVTMTSQPL